MNLDYLKVFYVAANNKNFSQTAKDLHISQSSVSLQIKQLENKWGSKLFERTTKKISLTPAGEILYDKVGKFISLMNETQNELDALKGIVHGDLKVGASLTIGEHILPFLLAGFSKRYPNVSMNLTVYNSEQIVEKLFNHEINVGFIESMLSYPTLTQIPFAEDELIIIASAQGDVAPHSSILTIEQLLHLPFIIREKGSGTRQVMEDTLRRRGVDPSQLNIILELEHTEAIKSSVEAGLGISIISKSAVKKELELKTLKKLQIDGMSLHRKFYIIYHEEALKQTSKKLIDFVLE
ncbi:selenium metabolism-associated LysR family transcriptional regulator [Pseudalkalibacillus hwajinpoensis]|uniref:selenium metabolism-associated LysR family transcriptional regulator n=1 Tax=Guptibacillus hwajinpoensis TaxID=208199 RepID=UPI001CD7CE90|nr:selenium metabolism-associated LysR family transcriptional regulator [Pseudalkalibacillus hwajinpoensis]MCA0993476.1 LysR family transcriptional regulator [Pseudalkalibacillus hwajinpoensis]